MPNTSDSVPLQSVLFVQLLDDPEAKRDAKRKRKEVLQQHRFSETFGAKSGQRQKKPKLTVDDYEALVAAASNKQDDYGSKNEGSADAYALKHEHHFAPVHFTSFICDLQKVVVHNCTMQCMGCDVHMVSQERGIFCSIYPPFSGLNCEALLT
jgi:hypothetical protein